jgi:hypothetical protein
VDVEFNLLVVIARSGRCARFVLHRMVVGASSKINWFWMSKSLEWLNPCFQYRQYRRKLYQSRSTSMGVVGGEPGNFAPDITVVQTGEDKKTSWGLLQVGILAAVHAQSEAEAKESEVGNTKGLWKNVKKALQSVGRIRSERTLMEKHVAATKIQRAWRNHVRFDSVVSLDDDFDLMVTDSDYRDLASHSLRSFEKGRQKSPLSSTSKDRKVGRLGSGDMQAKVRNSMTPESRFQSQTGKGRESQVGSDMRELTGQRVALGTIFALVCTVMFTYTESSTSWPTTMVVLSE